MSWWLVPVMLAAASEPLVVLRGSTRSDVVQQLRSELTALGFQVEVEPSTQALSWRSLRKRAREQRAVAAIQLEQAEGELELWVSDLSTGKVLIRALPTGGQGSARVVALRVVELLRLSFQEVGQPSTQDVKEADPPPQAVLQTLSPPAQPPRTHLVVGAVGLLSPGGVSPAGLLVVGGGFAVLPWLQVRAEGWIPLMVSRVEGPEGHAELRFWSAQAGARIALAPGARFEPGTSLRLGASGVEMVGSAIPPFVSTVDRVVVPSAVLAFDVLWRLSEALGLRAEVFAALTVPSIVVRFGTRDAARWGQPTVGLTLSLDVGLNLGNRDGP